MSGFKKVLRYLFGSGQQTECPKDYLAFKDAQTRLFTTTKALTKEVNKFEQVVFDMQGIKTKKKQVRKAKTTKGQPRERSLNKRLL